MLRNLLPDAWATDLSIFCRVFVLLTAQRWGPATWPPGARVASIRSSRCATNEASYECGRNIDLSTDEQAGLEVECFAQPLQRSNATFLQASSRTESLAKRDSVPQDESMTFPYFTSHKVFRSMLLFFFLLAVLTTSSSKSVKMITSWFNSNYQGQTFHKILVIGVAQNPQVRADFEDEMAAQIARAGIETIPGNHILLRPDPNVKLDLDYLRGQIHDNHIDAIVVSRLLNVDTKVTVVPSSTYIAPFPYYYSFYGYLGAVYPMVYDPGYTRQDTTVSIETNVYATSKPDGDLVWNGVSKSFNPKSAKKIADGLVKEVPKQMEKDGLLPKNVSSN
jgi:hypothetical protein